MLPAHRSSSSAFPTIKEFDDRLPRQQPCSWHTVGVDFAVLHQSLYPRAGNLLNVEEVDRVCGFYMTPTRDSVAGITNDSGNAVSSDLFGPDQRKLGTSGNSDRVLSTV